MLQDGLEFVLQPTDDADKHYKDVNTRETKRLKTMQTTITSIKKEREEYDDHLNKMAQAADEGNAQIKQLVTQQEKLLGLFEKLVNKLVAQ